MKKLKPEEIQEGKVFYSAEESVKVLKTETGKSQSPPLQVVFFQRLRKRGEERRLPIDDFCAQYKRRKRCR